MRPILPVLALTALLALPARGEAQADLLGGRSLLDWMGLEPGDALVFEDGDGQRCVTVAEPREIRGRRYAELRGLPWPGLASDSRVLVPLDGAVGLSVIATPGPRPNPRALLPEADSLLAGLPGGVDPGDLAAPGGAPGPDGWYAVAGEGGIPRLLVYRWCGACMDAGTTVVLERGRGIRSVRTTTIAGSRSLTRVEDASCAERAKESMELEIYVMPQDDGRP